MKDELPTNWNRAKGWDEGYRLSMAMRRQQQCVWPPVQYCTLGRVLMALDERPLPAAYPLGTDTRSAEEN